MFNLFRRGLDSFDSNTIVTVFTYVAIKYLNDLLFDEARRENSEAKFKRMNEDTYRNILELYLTILFGRALVRMTASRPEAIELDIPIPPSHPLLAGDSDIRTGMQIILSWTRDTAAQSHVSRNREKVPVWRNVLLAGMEYGHGRGESVEINFKSAFREQLSSARYDQHFNNKLCKQLTAGLDEVIDEVCEDARKLWKDIPTGERDAATEHFANTNVNIIMRMNSAKTYSAPFREGD